MRTGRMNPFINYFIKLIKEKGPFKGYKRDMNERGEIQ